jgi:2-dehydro-3-deoxyphosphogalactonate aldolase
MTTVNSNMNWSPTLPLIAILRGITPGETVAHVGALVALGFDTIEIPLNSPDWRISIKLAVDHFGERVWIGGGTVLSTQEVDTLQHLGARLIVAPNTRTAVIRHAVDRNLTMIPGVATPTEAFDALEAGAPALKVFPALAVGAGFVRALRAVLPPVPLYAVGGITPENLGVFIGAGAAGAGLGSDLYRPQQPVSRTESMARAYLQAFREAPQ